MLPVRLQELCVEVNTTGAPRLRSQLATCFRDAEPAAGSEEAEESMEDNEEHEEVSQHASHQGRAGESSYHLDRPSSNSPTSRRDLLI